MSSAVPDGWASVGVGDLGPFFGGLTGKTSKDFGEGRPFITYMQVFRETTGSKQDLNFVRISDSEKQNKVCFGDILFTTSSETPDEIGMATVFLEEEWSPYLNSFCFGLRPENNDACLDPVFSKYVFRGDKFRQDMRPLAQGSTRFNLSKENLKKLRLVIPPLPEQKKIASILTSVDEVIDNTQKQIDKLQDLKKATMNELLTEGIGHTEFKDSELGRIPKSWAISNVGKLAEFVTSGSRGWSQYYSSEGSLFIRIGNLTRDHVNLKFDDIQLVEPPSGGEGTRTKVKLGDILVSITADLGVIGVVNENLGEAYVNQHVCLIRLEPAKDINPRWVAHFLSGHAGQKQFEKKNDGGAKAGLNLPTVRSVLVPLPSLLEQNQAVRFLDKLDSDIVMKQKKLTKHKALKKSLMQDLLTGKVRVSVD